MTDGRKEGRKERIHNMGETAQCNKYKYLCICMYTHTYIYVKYIVDMIWTKCPEFELGII